MIPDSKTNFLYLADTLPKSYPSFGKEFEKILNRCGIDFDYLPKTRDVWAVDYMPIQVAKNNFVQFTYNPDYLRKYKCGQRSISDTDAICKAVGITPLRSSIFLDGGNVIRTSDKVILSDKVFLENPAIPEKELIKKLENLFQADKLIFVPVQPKDITGHADGMVRFYDRETVLINNYEKENKEFQLRFRMALHNAGLKYIEIPYNPYDNKKDLHANGAYINYLQMKQAIVLPVFGKKEDDMAIRQFEELFTGHTITTINSHEIAYDGGILNCITGNILK